MATNPVDLMGALNAYRQSLQAQREQLMQPAPQQGGFLSGADPVMLSLAAGLLSPTKTGAFGESIGAGLSAAAGPLAEIRKQEAARLDKLGTLNAAEAKLNMDLLELQQGGRKGYKPDDPLLRFNRYVDGRAAVEAGLRKAQDSGNEEEATRLKNQLKSLDQEADSIFGSGASEQAKKVTKGIEGQGAETEQEDKGFAPKLKSISEVEKLPSGTLFYDPNGILRRKP